MTMLFVLAQLADLATYSPTVEVNPVVLGLGPVAPVAKLALIGFVLLVSRIPRARPVLLVGIAAGVIGAASNLIATGGIA